MTVTEEDFTPIGPWRDWMPDYRGAVILPVDPDGRVLLQLRDRNPAAIHPGEWGLFGGGVEAGESLLTAVRREFAEETGIEAPQSAFSPFARIVSPVTRRRLFIFEARMKIAPADLSLGEGAGFGFFEPSDFARLPLIGSVRIILEHWRKSTASG